MDNSRLLKAVERLSQGVQDPEFRLSCLLEIYLSDQRGKWGEFALREIDTTISAMGGPLEILGGWLKIWRGTTELSILAIKAKKNILELVKGSELMLRVYCQLPKDDPLKPELIRCIDGHSKSEGFPFEVWEKFFQGLQSGDDMESYAIWGMSRTSMGDIEKSLKTYHYIFRFHDRKGRLIRKGKLLEDMCAEGILSLAPTVQTLIYVYAQAPKGSPLEEVAMRSIVEKLKGLKDRVEAYILAHRGGDLKKVLLHNIEQDVSGVGSLEKRFSLWLNICLRAPEGDELRQIADREVMAICNSVGKRAIKVLRDVSTRFSGSVLGDYVEARLRELAAAK